MDKFFSPTDSLKPFREKFYFPQHEGKDVIYFCGNSLGLQPKTTEKALLDELYQWKKYGVEGHFRGSKPWKDYHHFLTPHIAKVVGGKESEVVVMNTLTANLHSLMVSFYRPTSKRYKIVMEAGAFPSDQYAMETQARFHGFDPSDAIIEVSPREGEYTLRQEDIENVISENQDSIALIMFGGVNYYTGQLFDLKKITTLGHQIGAVVGFDLAHAAGNVPLSLHDWDVDFACWCSYKYLNSGPGGPGGIFVHERHHKEPLHRFAGWWGHDEVTRFQMKKGFIPMKGAASWQVSNAQIFSFAAHLASLEIFSETTMETLRAKSLEVTGWLYKQLKQLEKDGADFKIITPENETERGCQISILTGTEGKIWFEQLTAKGVIADWREPNVIRVAPTPLYNNMEDVVAFYNILKEVV